MKKFGIITGLAGMIIMMASCNKVRRNPGRAYMPDMAYSRAYETYASTEGLQSQHINYNAMPVPGTIARGDMYGYNLKNDSAGLLASANVKNPMPALNAKQYLEASRLYLVNCAICHGDKLDGNGPLYNNGKGPFQAAPRNLISDELMLKLPDGTYYHSITYGKGAMGSYASQVRPEQRWMIIHYIREKQALAGGAAGADTTAKAVTDTTAAPK